MPTLAHSARRLLIARPTIATLLAGLLAVLSPPALAATPPTPAWSGALSSYPTIFAHRSIGTESRPPGYLLAATNIGGAPTSGQFEVVNTLPAGLSFTIADGAYGSYGSEGTALDCKVTGQTVACSGGEPPLRPGETVRLNIPVAVAAGSFHSVQDEAMLSGGGAAPFTAHTETPVGIGSPAFGLLPGEAGLYGTISAADGSPATQAGSHPYQVSAGVNFPTSFGQGQFLAVGGGVKDLVVELPPGLIVNPRAVATRCTELQLENHGCPAAAQVGTATLSLSPFGDNPVVPSVALYEMVPPPGVPIEFGMELVEGTNVHLLGKMRSDGDYGLTARISEISAKSQILGALVTLWGNPSDEIHDYARGDCLLHGGTCAVERTNAAFLTLPGACGEPIATKVRADSWLEPGVFAEARFESPPADGCNRLEFQPAVSFRPTSGRADSPTGLNVSLDFPQRDDFDGLATANLRAAQIVFPDGLTVNPAVADGLAACSAGQVGLATAVGQAPIRFTAAPADCPDAAKLGTVEIDSSLLEGPLQGAIYLAQPYDNPFGSLLVIYVVADDPASGIVVKLAGRVEANPRSGRLTVFLDGVPDLPGQGVELHFFNGPRSLLKTPAVCGTHSAGFRLTPWSAPEGAEVSASDSFALRAGATASCPESEAEAPTELGFAAGTAEPRAGAYSPFVLRVSRDDGSQRLAALDVVLPPGLSGKLAGIPYCPEALLSIASCSPASKVGSVEIAVGAGDAPLHLGGGAYLTGPYKDAPLSLAIAVPAVAGPFDLGTVTARVALYVDPRSARIHAVSDPLPTILDGIPLDIRSLVLRLDRRGFTLNPTSCDPTSVAGLGTSTTRQSDALASHFQVGDCPRLGFRPTVSVRFLGPTRRGAHPKLRALLTARREDANIRRVALTLPGSELLDSRHIRAICSVAELAAKRCPQASVQGWAKVWSPLVDRPLEGPIYLRSSSGRLPGLAVALRGQVDLDLTARIDSVDGRLRTTFQALPDVPLAKVLLTMKGGKDGLFVNTGGLCASLRRAEASFLAHNAKSQDVAPVVKSACRLGA